MKTLYCERGCSGHCGTRIKMLKDSIGAYTCPSCGYEVYDEIDEELAMVVKKVQEQRSNNPSDLIEVSVAPKRTRNES
jgi:uncharacterized Zn finger protein (UPF0148 family)